MTKMLQVGEVAEILGVSRALIYREIQAGRLPHVRIAGRRVGVEPAQLEEFLAARRLSASEAAERAAEAADTYR